MKYKPAIIAYCAGVLDADGSFAVHLKKVAAGRPNGRPYFSGKIQIKQVHRGAIDLLHETFGGPSPRQVPASCPGGKPLYYWCISAAKAAEVCCLLLPHLRIKKRQAEILIELNEEIVANRYSFGDKTIVTASRWGGTKITKLRIINQESMARRYKLLNESRSLNDTRHPRMFIRD